MSQYGDYTSKDFGQVVEYYHRIAARSGNDEDRERRARMAAGFTRLRKQRARIERQEAAALFGDPPGDPVG